MSHYTPRRVAYDLESNGLLHQLDTIHCLHIQDLDTGELIRFDKDHVAQAVSILEQVDEAWGHNILGFDECAIAKVFPEYRPRGVRLDTLILSQMLFPNLAEMDAKFRKREGFDALPGRRVGSHALEAWGYRFKSLKGDYKTEMETLGLDPWAEWNPRMSDYCEQDVVITVKLIKAIQGSAPTQLGQQAIDTEMAVGRVISRQVRNGFPFHEQAAVDLYAVLVQRRAELEQELRDVFPPFYVQDGTRPFVPKRDNNRTGYAEGAGLIKIKLVDFKPGSRVHIANRLKHLHGWEPAEFTPDGRPKIDEEVLRDLEYPEARLIGEYLMVQKRIGQLAEGDNAWLKLVRNGRIHGSVQTNGTVTGRMTHNNPNVAQVPSNRAPYGKECRALFGPRHGWIQVGADADGLEARCLAHYMARYDGGAYVRALLDGNKALGTDNHSLTQKALELNSRDNAKTWLYAMMYGAGDVKLGSIIVADMTEAQRRKAMSRGSGPGGMEKVLRRLGKQSRDKISKGLPALGKLLEDVKAAYKARGFLKAIDGRRLKVRSAHSALNTLLQSAGALLMKRALVILDDTLQGTLGFTPGIDYEFLANIHDEWQIECRPEIAQIVADTACAAITQAGEVMDFRCPLKGNADIGSNWAECH